MLMNKQRGFSAIEGLLILVIIGTLGFIGWYVYSSNNKTIQTLDNAGKTSETVIKLKDNHQAEATTDTTPATTGDEFIQPDPSKRKVLTPSAAEKKSIQTAATAYLHRF